MSIQTVTSTVMMKRPGVSKSGKDMVRLELDDVEASVWAFGFNVKSAAAYNVGDKITVDFEDKGEEGKPFNIIKKIHSGSPSGSASSSSPTPSNTGGGSSYDSGKFESMYTSYVKDLVVSGLTVKKALVTLAEIKEGVKNLLNPPPPSPEDSRGASPSQEGRVRSLANQVGIDTDDTSWKNHIKVRYGSFTAKNANHVIELLEGVVNGTYGWNLSPDDEYIFSEVAAKTTTT